MEKQKFPVGIETFSEIREKGYVYVDKTQYIYDIISEGKYYFLSRPRRFGKSLLLSTIKSLFEGRRDLFEGLHIASCDWDWQPHPVFHLNFVGMKPTSEGINSLIENHLKEWEEKYGLRYAGLDFSQRFYNVIRNSVEVTSRQAVVLIDEYDKALVNTIHHKELHDEFRNILKPLYSNLKAADEYICFGMITGVSRFSKMSIFSDINNLHDISLDDRYSAICGITEEEVLRDCQYGISRLAAENNISEEEAMESLKRHYDGYHFSQKCPDLYNPYSIFSAFRDCAYKSYWFSTGTPTFLMERLRDGNIYLPDFLQTEADVTELSDIDSYDTSEIALLFQTGYLTIKGYDREYDTYILGLPNLEVSHAFFKKLLPVYMNFRESGSLQTVRQLCRCVNTGDPAGFLSRLQSFLAGIPYDLSRNKPEIYFENNIFIIFRLMGFTVETEYRTSSGRIDLLVKTKDFIYVIELKLKGTAEDAIHQIEDKEYAKQFSTDPRKLFKIGISFSSQTRNIDNWIISHK